MNSEYDLLGPATGEPLSADGPVLDRNALAVDTLKLVRKHVIDDLDVECAASSLYKLIYE